MEMEWATNDSALLNNIAEDLLENGLLITKEDASIPALGSQ